MGSAQSGLFRLSLRVLFTVEPNVVSTTFRQASQVAEKRLVGVSGGDSEAKFRGGVASDNERHIVAREISDEQGCKRCEEEELIDSLGRKPGRDLLRLLPREGVNIAEGGEEGSTMKAEPLVSAE